MILQMAVTGVFTTNAYFFIDEETRHGFLIDPGAEADRLLSVIREKRLVIEKILLTHGHFDHFGAAPELCAALSAPVCMHEAGRAYAENPAMNLSGPCGIPMRLSGVTYLPDGSRLSLAARPSFLLDMVRIPGHTEDGVMYYSAENRAAFVGDSVFRNSFGLTHFPGGDAETLMQSVTRRILTLPDDTALLSGHTEPTTVGEEKTRPWFAGKSFP